MRGQNLADFVNRFCKRLAEVFILKMNAHSIHDVLPEVLATFFVNRFIADNGELVRSRRYENQYGIALTRLVHSESLKLFLRNNQRIGFGFAPLDIDPNLTGGL